MNQLELYKEWHYKEMERKEHLENSLNFPFGIMSALFAVWFYLATNYDYSLDGYNNYFFNIFMVISLLLIIVAVIFLLTSYHHLLKLYKYGYMPDASKVDNYHKELVEWHKKNNSTTELAEKDFEDFFLACYMKASSCNSFQNKRKTAYLHRGKSFLYYSILSLLVTSFSFGYNSYPKKEKEIIHKVIIVNQK